MKPKPASILINTVLLFFSLNLFAQNKTIDSLQKVLQAQKEDTNKVNTLNYLSRTFWWEAHIPDSAIEYASKAIALSKKINFKKGTADAYYNLGTAFAYQNNIPESLKNYYSALRIFEQIKYKENIAKTLEAIGGSLLINNQGNEGLQSLQEALKIRLQIGDKAGIAQSYTTIGQYYNSQQKYSLALENTLAAKKIFEELGEKGPGWSLAYSYGTIGEIYESQADSLQFTGNRLASKQKHLDAIASLLKSKGIWEKINNKEGIAAVCYHLGKNYIGLEVFTKAKEYLEKSLQISIAIRMNRMIVGCYFALTEINRQQGNFQKAYEHLSLCTLYRDSLYNEDNARKIEQYKIQYEVDKKEEQIKLLSAENKLQTILASKESQQKNFAYIGIGVILFVSSYGFYRFRKRKKLQHQQALMNERLRISRELHDEVGATLSGIAMYSHLAKEQIKSSTVADIENSLNIMQQSSGEMVNKLNDIVWLINPEQDSLQKLIQRLEEYATDMATIKNMKVKINVPEHLHEHALPMESRRNIYLFCKEAINNAVKYSNGTLLELNIKESNNILEFSVSDNGNGFDAVMVRRGNGLENMQKRADEIGGKLIIQSKQNEGVSVSMQIKTT